MRSNPGRGWVVVRSARLEGRGALFYYSLDQLCKGR